jgi:flagellar biosynthesis chaperone FliJ
MEDLVFNYFSYEICSDKLDSIVDLIKKPALASNIRFTASLSDGMYSSKIQDIEAFLEERPEYIIKYTEELTQKGGDVQKARELLAHNDSNNDDTLDEQSETEVEESENNVNAENNTEEIVETVETEENTNG